MRRAQLIAVAVLVLMAVIGFMAGGRDGSDVREKPLSVGEKDRRVIEGFIRKGENFYRIFKKHHLDLADLSTMNKVSAPVYKLTKLDLGQSYRIVVEPDERVRELVYLTKDDEIVTLSRSESGFVAGKRPVEYEKKLIQRVAYIEDNLVMAMGEDRENVLLALQLSDIFAWDLDFTTDLRKGDRLRVIVEGLYSDGEFKKYGEIVTAELVNDGQIYRAYRFEHDGEMGYYDEEGRPLKKAFLKAPLSYRAVTSVFSRSRLHPIRRIYRPHRGVDYAAPTGTPISAVGDAAVVFSGYRAGYGKLIVLSHRNGYMTYYGHLSRIREGIRKGTRADQGEIIGYVGATGLATGPHLHYEMRVNGTPVNPLVVKADGGTPIPPNQIAAFQKLRQEMDASIASISPGTAARRG